MQRLISNDQWTEVRRLANKVNLRKAAIAFVTQDLIGFRGGDVLIVNASEDRIRCGDTDAQLLQTLDGKNVEIYSCSDLHAKVLLLDGHAVIGSANMSQASKNLWIEACLVTDQSTVVAGVASFIEQLLDGRSTRLKTTDIRNLCRIKVERRRNGGMTNRRTRKISQLGQRMWLLSAVPCEDYPDSEESQIDSAIANLGISRDNLEWIRLSDQSRIQKECREGDVVVQMWRSSFSSTRCTVYPPMPVLLKQATKGWTRFYFPAPGRKCRTMTWRQFTALLNKVGYNRQVKPTSTQEVRAEFIDLIIQNWASAARKKAK